MKEEEKGKGGKNKKRSIEKEKEEKQIWSRWSRWRKGGGRIIRLPFFTSAVKSSSILMYNCI